jgi:thiol-disulfide isomerase/thioredoxin
MTSTRFPALLATLLMTANLGAEPPASKLWNELKAKREKLSSVHQEFEATQTSRTARAERSMKREVTVDISQGQWREKSVTGSGTRIRIFDGRDLVSMEEGDDEYTRTKPSSKGGAPLPEPYEWGEPDWAKAVELERRPCRLSGNDHQCVILRAPLKPWLHNSSTSVVRRMLEGTELMVVDLETGLLVSLQGEETIESSSGLGSRKSEYQRDFVCKLKRMRYGAPADASLFTPPGDGMHEVKELSRWNAAKIRKQLAGKPAPDLALIDMQGRPVALSAFKGKTVLLDFWTTWCPPCRADAPSLDKLYSKYGGQDLVIVGISVSEEIAVVEKFLKDHPHSFSIALTTENEMPRPYQIGVFPTYIVIDKDGLVESATEGDQGFSELRRLLKKAGLEVD